MGVKGVGNEEARGKGFEFEMYEETCPLPLSPQVHFSYKKNKNKMKIFLLSKIFHIHDLKGINLKTNNFTPSNFDQNDFQKSIQNIN